MSDPILLFLTVDAIALLLLGVSTHVLPAASRFVVTILCGFGTLLCLPPLLMRADPARLVIPIGPPGLSLHLALDPLSTFFLVIALLAGTAIAAFHATAAQPPASARMIACCLGGIMIALLAADAVTLALGLTAACIAINQGGSRSVPIPFLLLIAVILLTPPGYAPRFDTIAAAPIDPGHATAAAILTIAAAGALAWQPVTAGNWSRDSLCAGVLIPFGLYIVLRVTIDLSGSAAQSWWGFVLVLVGGAAAVAHAWHAASTPSLDTAIAALMRRQAGLATTTIGLALIARGADLPGAATFALEATCLAAIAAAMAGTLATLAAHTIGTSAGTYRLAGLGGLVHPMPGTSTALAASLLALSALPPTLGFAALWLAFQSVLSAPRTGGLVAQLPLALAAAALAGSAALAITASVRIVGIAILGRPRTPRGAGAAESQSPVRTILLTLAALSLLAGILPGPTLWLLADPAIHAVTGLAANRGLAVLSVPGSSPTYFALPVLALIGLAAAIPLRVLRRKSAPAKAVGPWTEGMEPPIGLPFGDPAAQSTGAGFLPPLKPVPWPRMPHLPQRPALPATAGPWLLVVGFAALLLILTIVQ